MQVLTVNHSILTTRNVTWQIVPSSPPPPPQQRSPIVKEGEFTAGEGASGDGASHQGGERVDVLDSEFDLDMAEVWPQVPPAVRKAPVAEPGASAEGNPPTPSVSPGRADFDGINDSSSSRSSDHSRTRSDSSNSNDSGDLPTLVERSARGLEVAWPTPRHAKRTQEALVTGLDHERVVRGCPAGVCNEDRGN